MSALQQVMQRIQSAAQYSGRSPAEINLVAVSKTKSTAAIMAAYDAGIRHFGENRTEELVAKAAALSHVTDLKWHFIGHLQSRQSQPVATLAHYFHAIDRIKIATRLSAQLHQLNRILPVFIQVNISGESSKGGFLCSDWEKDDTQRSDFLHAIESMAVLPNLPLCGLMTMAPLDASKSAIRTLFQRLKTLSIWLNEQLPTLEAHALSMGMSGDFEIAIEEGATHIRVGSAIFADMD